MNFPNPGAEVRREFSERIVGPDNRPHHPAQETVTATAKAAIDAAKRKSELTRHEIMGGS